MTARATLHMTGHAPERTDPDVFAEHLRANARQYYPELEDGPVEVRASGGSIRPASVLYEFELRFGETVRPVLVKMPLIRSAAAPDQADRGGDRPRLAQPMPTEGKFLLEHRALRLVHEHFTRLGDPRFGTVRPLDMLRAHRAVVMETVDGETLRKMYYGRRLDPPRPDALENATRAAGAWLRSYHALGAEASAQPRHARSAEHVTFVRRLTEFLADLLREHAFFQRVAASHAAAARESLPDLLPLGLGHGDFAPRNVLVAPSGRVTVLDTLARHLVPIYEDIGYFLTSLHCNWLQVLSIETALPGNRAAACEEAFLAGYFGDEPVPYEAVRLYEVQAMLDLWVATAYRQAHAPGHGTRFTERVKLTLLSRILRRRIEALLP